MANESETKHKIPMKATSLPHVYTCDIYDTGMPIDILLVKEFKDGSIYYIELASLHGLDKARIKNIITAPGADKFECWELLSQARLSNGMNALDFFHMNNVKTKRPKGASIGNALENLPSFAGATSQIVGQSFVNPSEVSVAQGAHERTIL